MQDSHRFRVESSAQILLTVIISLRTSPQYDMIGRLKNKLLDTERPDRVTFLVVDEGSSLTDAVAIKEECDRLSFAYHRVESGRSRFCASTARNAGARVACSRYILHEDIDLFPYPGFYNDILQEIVIQGLPSDPTRFITVPAVYLTDAATEMAISGAKSKNGLVHDLLIGAPTVRGYLPASSAIVVSRAHYLAIGGYNPEFDGWGLEDLEFAYRLTAGSRMFPQPADNDVLVERDFSRSSRYIGWRMRFRLHGELLARKGIFTFHAFHPKSAEWANKALHENNRNIFDACIRRFKSSGQYLAPITDYPAPPQGGPEHVAPLPWRGQQIRGLMDQQKLEGHLPSSASASLVGATAGPPLNAPIYDAFRYWIEVETTAQFKLSFECGNDSQQLLALATLLFKERAYGEAAKVFDHIAALRPTNTTYLRQAAEAHYRAGAPETAIRRLTAALNLKPDNRVIRRRLKEMRSVWLPKLLHKPFKIK